MTPALAVNSLATSAFFPQKRSTMKPLFFGLGQCPITGNAFSRKKVLSNQPDTNLTLNRVISSTPSLSVLYGTVSNPQSARILAYLAAAESREPLPWLKDDIRISWLTVLHCAEGIADPWRYAFWKYLGAVPEKIIPQLMTRAEAHRLMEVPDFDPTAKIAPSAALPANKKEIA